jgi:hypothetical protein
MGSPWLPGLRQPREDVGEWRPQLFREIALDDVKPCPGIDETVLGCCDKSTHFKKTNYSPHSEKH